MGDYGEIIHLFLEEIMDRIKVMNARCTYLLIIRVGRYFEFIAIASKSAPIRQVTFIVNPRAVLSSNSGANSTKRVE
jgi:hypothetical protein